VKKKTSKIKCIKVINSIPVRRISSLSSDIHCTRIDLKKKSDKLLESERRNRKKKKIDLQTLVSRQSKGVSVG
jgi:hypothetical protein